MSIRVSADKEPCIKVESIGGFNIPPDDLSKLRYYPSSYYYV